jgi:hypothetical protein
MIDLMMMEIRIQHHHQSAVMGRQKIAKRQSFAEKQNFASPGSPWYKTGTAGS